MKSSFMKVSSTLLINLHYGAKMSREDGKNAVCMSIYKSIL